MKLLTSYGNQSSSVIQEKESVCYVTLKGAHYAIKKIYYITGRI